MRSSTKGKPAKIDARGHLTHDLILSEAAALFKKQGYRKTSLENLASQLGVTRPAFYYWFKSKTEILVEIQNRAIDGLQKAADEVDLLHLDERELFWRHIEAHVEYVANHAVEVGVVFEEEEELPPDVATAIRKQRREYTDRMVELFTVDASDPKNSRLAVYTIVGAATWAYRWYRPELGSPSEVAKKVVAVLRSGQ